MNIYAITRADPNIGDLLRREHPKIRWSRIRTFLRLVPKSVTLDDLEWLKSTYAEKSFYGAHTISGKM